MVHVSSLSIIGSALVGLSNAAALGTAEEYADGTVHARIMAMKTAQWDAEIASGEMDSTRYPELGYTSCENGFAAAIPGDFNNTFKCHNIDLYHFLHIPSSAALKAKDPLPGDGHPKMDASS